MKLSELKNKYEEPIQITFKDEIITISKYISEELKLYIANQIKKIYFGEDVFTSQEGSDLNANDLSNKYLKFTLTTFYLLSFYTDIEIDETNYLEIVNLVMKSGLYDIVISNIPVTELGHLFSLIDLVINEEYRKIQENNSVENQLKRFLQMAIEKIPSDKKILDLMKKVKKEFNNFDPSKLDFLNQMNKEFNGKSTPTPENLNKITDNVIQMVNK